MHCKPNVLRLRHIDFASAPPVEGFLSDKIVSEEEGDMNEPSQGFSLSGFSKSKKGRVVARRQLFKSHRDLTSGVLNNLEDTIEEQHTNETISIDEQISQYESIENEEEPEFNFLHDKISEESPALTKDIVLADSQSKPKLDIWNDMNILSTLNLKPIPLGKFFEIPQSSSSFASVSLIVENVLSSDDVLTTLTNCCIKYQKPKPDSLVFVEVYAFTSSGCRRDKYTPFIIGYIFPFGTIDESSKLLDFEGLYHVTPRSGTFSENNILKRLQGSVSRDIRNGLVKSLKRNFPPDSKTEVVNFSKDTVPQRFSSGLSSKSLGIVKISNVRNPTAVFIVAYNDTQVLLDLLKPVGQSSTRWKHVADNSKWFPRSSLLVTSVPADQISQAIFVLRNSPKTILKQLKISV